MATNNKAATDRVGVGAADKTADATRFVKPETLPVGLREAGSVAKFPTPGLRLALADQGSVRVLGLDTTPPVKMGKLILMTKGWA